MNRGSIAWASHVDETLHLCIANAIENTLNEFSVGSSELLKPEINSVTSILYYLLKMFTKSNQTPGMKALMLRSKSGKTAVTPFIIYVVICWTHQRTKLIAMLQGWRRSDQVLQTTIKNLNLEIFVLDSLVVVLASKSLTQ